MAMKYNSIPEYFYKLYGRLYALILLPLVCFGLLYWEMKTGTIEPISQDIQLNQILLLAVIVVLLAEWTASFFLFRNKVKSILTLGSLGDRLDRYYQFTLIRFSFLVSGLVLLAVGFFITRDQYFSILFLGSMVGLGVLWPTSAKVCDDLRLKGDERKLILYKLDKLS